MLQSKWFLLKSKQLPTSSPLADLLLPSILPSVQNWHSGHPPADSGPKRFQSRRVCSLVSKCKYFPNLLRHGVRLKTIHLEFYPKNSTKYIFGVRNTSQCPPSIRLILASCLGMLQQFHTHSLELSKPVWTACSSVWDRASIHCRFLRLQMEHNSLNYPCWVHNKMPHLHSCWMFSPASLLQGETHR